MNVILLAAGEGTRLRPFTESIPKPAIPFMGVPLASYSLSLLDRIPIDRLVVNTYHLPSNVRKLFADIPKQWKELEFASEEGNLLDSGGGIHNAMKYLKGRGDFFVMNADEVMFPHQSGLLEEMISFHKWHKGIATLLTIEHPEVGSKFGGAWLSQGTKIECFSKKNPGPHAPRGLHYVGVLILSDRIFNYFKPQIEKENILYDTLTAAMARGEEVHAFECQSEWFEIGNPHDFMKATQFCVDTLSAALAKPGGDRPYWQEYLMQTIRLFGENQFLIERDWQRFSELQSLVQKIKNVSR